jgi:hypothetical protein
MAEPYTGGCACGAIRYETSSEPIVQNHCQCNGSRSEAGRGMGPIWPFRSGRR